MWVKKIIQVLIVILSFWVVFPNAALAQKAFDHQQARDQVLGLITANVEQALPLIDQVIPGYRRPLNAPPGLIIGDLRSDSDDGINWGLILGRLLRQHIANHETLFVASPDPLAIYTGASSIYKSLHDDILVTKESLALLSGRLGIYNVISGDVSFRYGFFNIELVLRNMQTNKVIDMLNISVHQNKLLPELLKIDQLILKNLYKHGSIKYLQPASFLNFKDFDQLLAFAKAHTKPIPHDWYEDALSTVDLWKRGMRSPVLADDFLYYSYYSGRDGVNDPAYINIKNSVELSRDVILGEIRYMRHRTDGEIMAKAAELKSYVAEFPDDPLPLFILANVISNSEMLSIDAMTVSTELLRQWPNDYRSWAAMAKSIYSYAWYIRGHEYNYLTDKKDMEFFKRMMPVADQAADVAINIQPEDAELYILKMKVNPGYSKLLIETFYEAIKYNPRNYKIYSNALNNSLDKWGGNAKARELIFAKAKRYINNKKILDLLEKRYMKKAK